MQYRLGAWGRSSANGRPKDREHRLERDLTEEIARFLSEADGRSFCHTCLAALVGTDFEKAKKAVYALRVTGEVRVGTARCSACYQRRVCIEALSS